MDGYCVYIIDGEDGWRMDMVTLSRKDDTGRGAERSVAIAGMLVGRRRLLAMACSAARGLNVGEEE